MREQIAAGPDLASSSAERSIVVVENLSKWFSASLAHPRGTWISSGGLALWIRNLRRALTTAAPREVKALSDVTLRVERGEIFGLLGRNGAGKTTLVKILAGLIAPTSGDAYVNGISARRDPAGVKRSVSYVSTTGWMGLEWQLTVRENLILYARLFGLDRGDGGKRADRALADVGLALQANRGVHQLSHGMRQRLVLARGLLVRTPLVYLDEPTVGLDPVTASDIRRLIKDTINRERGQTVLLTGHFIPELEELCDRVAVIDRGRILAVGTPAELKQRVADRGVMTLRVVGWEEAVRAAVGSIAGVLGVSLVAQDLATATALIRVHHRRPGPELQNLLDCLRRSDARVVFASEEDPTLEDAFLALTGGDLR